jgi:hypothetical protein
MCMMALAVAGSLIGGVIQGAGAIQQGNAQAAAEEARAKMAERQREINATQASFESQRTGQQLDRIRGNNRAAGAERGLSDTGSLVDVADDNNFEAAQDLEAIRYRAEGEHGNLLYEERAAKQRARSARTAGRIGGFGAVLGGVTSAATTLGNSYYSRPLTT